LKANSLSNTGSWFSFFRKSVYRTGGGRYRRRFQESASEISGWCLAIAILLILATAFGAGYLIVRPLYKIVNPHIGRLSAEGKFHAAGRDVVNKLIIPGEVRHQQMYYCNHQGCEMIFKASCIAELS